MSSCDPSDEDKNWIGMKPGSVPDVRSVGLWPLLKLSKALTSVHSNILPDVHTGNSVVGTLFASYGNNAVAPDHLLTCLSKVLVQTCFLQLPTSTTRAVIDISVCYAMREIGFDSHSTIMNPSTKHLNCFSMPAMY